MLDSVLFYFILLIFLLFYFKFHLDLDKECDMIVIYSIVIIC